MSTVHIILDYEYRHKNKGTDQVGTSEIMCEELRAKSYKMCTNYRECMCIGKSHLYHQSTKLKINMISYQCKDKGKLGNDQICMELQR